MQGQFTRRKFLVRSGIGAGALLAPGLARATSSSGSAATAIVNGRVITAAGRPVQQAIAIGRDGRIMRTGSNADVRRLVGRNTDVVSADGGTVIAGIHDGHAHPMYAGLEALNPSLGDGVYTVPELQAVLTGFLEDSADQEPDGWLQVADWNPVGLLPTGTVAHRQYLDPLPTARPIALSGSDGHNTWVNSRALELAGIDAGTADPPGGEIVRDADGPTGLLKDTAQELVTAVIPEPEWEVQLAAMTDAFAFMAASGITSCTDAWVDPWQLDAYAELAGRKALHQRIIASLLIPEELIGSPREAVAWAKGLARAYRGIPRVRFGTVKVFMDGVIEFPAQTAALLEPYLDANGVPTDNYGELYIDGETMGALTTAFDARGWQVHAHAIGDAGARAALDGYQAAKRANGRRDNRHTIAHLQLVHPDDYPRFARLGVIPDMQLQWAVRDVYTIDALEPYLGPERHRRLYPAGSLLAAGAPLAGGSDWPVDPLYPWNQVQTAIDRIGLYGEGGPLYAEQGIGRLDSLRMHTAGTAFQMHQERSTGTLQRGKYADLVVLDRDLTRVPVSEIKDAQVRLTLLGGRPTYDADSPAGRRLLRRSERAGAVAAASAAAKIGRPPKKRCPCVRREPGTVRAGA